MRIECMNFLIEHSTYIYSYIRTKWIWPLEAVLEIEKHRVLIQCFHLRSHFWNSDHIRCILHNNTRVAMIRVIVIWPWCENYICIPFPDFSYYLQTYFQSWHE